MKLFGSVLVGAAAAACAAAHDAEWKVVGRSDPATLKSDITVALQEKNLEALEAAFWAVSDPSSPDYGKHWSAEDVATLTATPAEDVADATAWLSDHGLECRLAGSRTALSCSGRVGALEAAFSTEIHHHVHPKNGVEGHFIPADGSWSWPADERASSVRFIEGLTAMPLSARMGRHARSDVESRALNQNVMPVTLQTMYNIPNTTAAGSSSVKQAAIELQNLPPYTVPDLNDFEHGTNINYINITKKVGPYSPGLFPAAESALDVQYLGAVGAGNTNWYWTEKNWLYSWANDLISTPADMIDVASISYGWAEDDQCTVNPGAVDCKDGQDDSYAYVGATNTAFMKLGTMGVTVVVASGDSGAHGRTDSGCSKKSMTPVFPGASPYVTTVGATMFGTVTAESKTAEPICGVLQCTLGGDEIVASTATGADIVSGGGFSNVAPMPSYQKDAVASFLSNSTNTPGAGNFNATGRGYPDVAALGHRYYVVLFGLPAPTDGTSCATPVFAGILALLNANRVRNGQPKIGFANPLLYKMAASHPAAFNDITSGSNACTEDGCNGCQGYTATQGWDAVTGLGTPNFKEMLAADSMFV